MLRVGAIEKALEGVVGEGGVLAVDDLEPDFGGGGGDLADAGVDDLVGLVALSGEAREVRARGLFEADLPGGDEGERALEAEVLEGLGGEGERAEFEEGHCYSRGGRRPGRAGVRATAQCWEVR